MRCRTFIKTLAGMCTIAALIGVLPSMVQAAPCTGAKRLQVRWSKKTGTALVSLSATQCDRPPNCSDAAARTAGSMFTQSPVTVTIKDAGGHSASSTMDAGAADCTGRCERVNRGGCVGGSDTHRRGGSFVRYVVNAQGQTTVVANKLKIASPEQPSFATPITITVTDAAGYAVTAELQKCRVRAASGSAAIACQ